MTITVKVKDNGLSYEEYFNSEAKANKFVKDLYQKKMQILYELNGGKGKFSQSKIYKAYYDYHSIRRYRLNAMGLKMTSDAKKFPLSISISRA